MNKLKNTQANMSKVNQEYIEALDNAYTSQESRIENLKKKLQKHRSKYMHPSNGVLRNGNASSLGSNQSQNRSKSVN